MDSERFRGNKRPDLIQQVEAIPDVSKSVVLANLGAIQLTVGCSAGCGDDFCSISAIRGIGKSFDYDSVVAIFQRYGSQMPNMFSLYWASDPIDYYRYPELLDQAIKNLPANRAVYTSTALPIGREERVRDTITVAAKHNQVVRISVNDFNAPRVSNFIDKFYHGTIPDNVKFEVTDDNNRYRVGDANDKPLLEHEVITAKMLRDYTENIVCFDGVIITPSGPEARVLVGASPLSPRGYISWPIKTERDPIPRYNYVAYNQRWDLINQNESLPDVQLVDGNGELTDTPLDVVAQRDYLFLAEFAYHMADFGIPKNASADHLNGLYDLYRFRMDRAKGIAKSQNLEPLNELLDFIDRAVSDLWPQAINGRKFKRHDSTPWPFYRDETFGLVAHHPVPKSTDLSKYK